MLMALIKNTLLGVIFIIVGIIIEFCAPKEISGYFGYRTFFSMKNKGTWEEGNRFSGIMSVIGGSISLIFSIFITFLYINNQIIGNEVSAMGTLIIALASIFYTEIHLRKIFDKDGKRKVKH